MSGLSASGLAGLAGVTEAEVDRLVQLGILVARAGAGPFLETDVQKVRLAVACEQAGLPMEGIASAIRAGRLSFAFLEAAPFRRWAVRSARTYRQVSQATGVRSTRSARCWSRWGSPGWVPTSDARGRAGGGAAATAGPLQRIFDLAWLTRLGRAHVEGLRLITTAWGEAYQARFEGPVLASGANSGRPWSWPLS